MIPAVKGNFLRFWKRNNGLLKLILKTRGESKNGMLFPIIQEDGKNWIQELNGKNRAFLIMTALPGIELPFLFQKHGRVILFS